MKTLIDRLLGVLGWELRPRGAARSRAFDDDGLARRFGELIDRTEGMISFAEAELLYRLARDLEAGAIVEVGSYRGRSAVALGRGALDGHRRPVYAVEPHEPFVGVLGGEFGPADRGAFYRAMLDTGCFHAVRLIALSSEVVTPGWQEPVGLLWLDGDHSYTGVKRDWECWRPHLAERALVAFDDSLDPRLGPHRLIAELLASGAAEAVERAGKVTVLRLLPDD